MNTTKLPTAQEWYATKSYPNGVVRIFEQHIDSYWSGNIWMISGSEKSLVVDTGTGIVSPLPTLASITDKPLIATVSCCYYDHAGGFHYFDHRACHSLDAPAIEDISNDMGARYFKKYAQLSAVPYDDFEIEEYQPGSTSPSDFLEDGGIIDLGNRQIEILHVSGRTPGSLVLWEAETGYMFGGETLFIDPFAHDFQPNDVASYEDSLVRLSKIPATTIFGGHFEPFTKGELLELVGNEVGRYH
ncbi:MBL fold metallo-hydrolase [Gammaproteobacteria bacterium]|nr:MBL fold metallo-hydrolase [Gammaproteobacteria bacterium]